MRARTDFGALIFGAVLAGVLGAALFGDGRPSHTPPRAPVTPLASDQAVPSFHTVPSDGTPDKAGSAPAPSPTPETGVDADAPSVDGLMLRGGKVALVYLPLFLLAHLGLRKSRLSKPWTYAGAGTAALLISLVGQTPMAGWRHLQAVGDVGLYILGVAGAGAMIGFIYRWRVGLEPEGDDPASLDAALRVQTDSGAALQPAYTPPAHVATDNAEYFSGPVQVKTSIPIMFVAALAALGIYGAGLFGVGRAARLAQEAHVSLAFLDSVQGVAGVQAALVLGAFLIWALPLTFLIFLSHQILRAANKSSQVAYGVAGLLSPLLLALLTGPLGAILGVQTIIPVVMALAFYRNMAGLEPKAVKEDIVVRDRRNLVGADHARRVFGRIIQN